jgi:pyruvate/2-oxoacid:ferredoxin oxidoreductase beta subunit/Pyruvate/2-oxoacid:ferredoxin oxidoreductase gamma subunit
MDSLLNENRPPLFCPGCAHERIAKALDQAFSRRNLEGHQIAMVSDIGCSGLFDTFFKTHALHGLHGRALTYAAGLKMARPEMKVIVTMGDGGIGIGGAHFVAACRRNLDLTLLILNNFNFGMTGGQYSVTTPPQAQVGSGFLNQLEPPLDIGAVAVSAGAGYVTRCSGYRKDLPDEIARALAYEGFSVLDIWGICPGRYTKRNRLTPKSIEAALNEMDPIEGPVTENQREEYGRRYRDITAELRPPDPLPKVEPTCTAPAPDRQEVVILGSAGQRVLTAGEIMCYAGLFAGLNTTQKNDYPITVLRGYSISELILSPQDILYTGIAKPSVVLALGQEGVNRRRDLFSTLDEGALIIQAIGIDLPTSRARVQPIDLRKQKIRSQDWALASLAVLAKLNRVITMDMLTAALATRFKGDARSTSLELIERTQVDT